MCSKLTLPHFLYLPGVFLGLGLSGVIPTLHFVISEGLLKAATMGQIGWLALMACLYITGAALYAARIPERFFPGKCDIWVSLRNDWMRRPMWKLVPLEAGGCCISGVFLLLQVLNHCTRHTDLKGPNNCGRSEPSLPSASRVELSQASWSELTAALQVQPSTCAR